MEALLAEALLPEALLYLICIMENLDPGRTVVESLQRVCALNETDARALLRGMWHAHLGWLFDRRQTNAERYAPDDDLFAGAAYDKVPSRAGAHWWSLLGTLLLTPVAWYLLSDAGARMTLPADNQWDSGVLNLAALGELLGGIVVLAVILLAARASSLGAFVVGSLVALIGGAFVLFPAVTQDFAEPYLQWLRDYNDFGGNIAHHLVSDGSTGRILVAGIALILVGIVSHNARRRGRREQTIREAIDRRKAAAV